MILMCLKPSFPLNGFAEPIRPTLFFLADKKRAAGVACPAGKARITEYVILQLKLLTGPSSGSRPTVATQILINSIRFLLFTTTAPPGSA